MFLRSSFNRSQRQFAHQNRWYARKKLKFRLSSPAANNPSNRFKTTKPLGRSKGCRRLGVGCRFGLAGSRVSSSSWRYPLVPCHLGRRSGWLAGVALAPLALVLGSGWVGLRAREDRARSRGILASRRAGGDRRARRPRDLQRGDTESIRRSAGGRFGAHAGTRAVPDRAHGKAGGAGLAPSRRTTVRAERARLPRVRRTPKRPRARNRLGRRTSHRARASFT